MNTHQQAAMAERIGNWVLTLKKARREDYLLTITGYCDHPGCPARTVETYVKDYDRELLDLIAGKGLRCPLCAGVLKCHYVWTSVQARAAEERNARMSVNEQVYRRDHGPCIPCNVLLDERLPPSKP